MKTSYITPLGLALVVGLVLSNLASAQEEENSNPAAEGPDITLVSSRTIDMKPSHKQPLSVQPDERNPYAKRAPEEEKVVENGEASQENRIRNRLLSMPVGGASLGNEGRQILVGSIILKKGKKVEPLIPDQTEHLKVLDITENEINFGWIDLETGEMTGKTMQIAYDLSPGVRYLLPGTSINDKKEDRLMGVIKVDEKRKQVAAEYERVNPRNRLPAGVYERAQ